MKPLPLSRIWLAAAGAVLLLLSVYLLRGVILPDPETEWVTADDEMRRLLEASEGEGHKSEGISSKSEKPSSGLDSSKSVSSDKLPAKAEGSDVPLSTDKKGKQEKEAASDSLVHREAAAGPSKSQGKLNLNTATAEQLDGLPGIGPSRAEAILELRKQLGGTFRSIEQLDQVKGIGEQTMTKLRPLVTVETH